MLFEPLNLMAPLKSRLNWSFFIRHCDTIYNLYLTRTRGLIVISRLYVLPFTISQMLASRLNPSFKQPTIKLKWQKPEERLVLRVPSDSRDMLKSHHLHPISLPLMVTKNVIAIRQILFHLMKIRLVYSSGKFFLSKHFRKISRKSL